MTKEKALAKADEKMLAEMREASGENNLPQGMDFIPIIEIDNHNVTKPRNVCFHGRRPALGFEVEGYLAAIGRPDGRPGHIGTE